MKYCNWSFSKSLVISLFWLYIIIDILFLGTAGFDLLGYIILLGVPILLWLIIFVLSLICYAYQQQTRKAKMLFTETMTLLRYSFFVVFLIMNTFLISLFLFLLGCILTGQFDD